MESASAESLKRLWRTVEPKLDGIDEFIASHAEPLPDEALLLGAIAQAAHEARLELERRGPP